MQREVSVAGRVLATALLLGDGLNFAAAAEPRFGLNLREQVESISDDVLGEGGRSDLVAQHRLLAHMEWPADVALRVFVQLGAYAQNGRNGGSSPVDESAPDVHQGYLDWQARGEDFALRAGRQEWVLGSGRLVSVRDGPNLRRAFDGVRLQARFNDALEGLAFAGRPVRNLEHAFDDRHDDGQRLAGLQLSWRLSDTMTAEIYALDYGRDGARFASGLADEERRSWGLRTVGQAGPWDLDVEAIWQTGQWGLGQIRAWTVATDVGWTMQRLASRPRVGLKADVASGDADLDDGRLQTFNALYPNPSYFSDAGLISPANLVDLQPNVSWSLSGGQTLYLGWNLLWKHRSADAVYTTPVPLAAVPGSQGRQGFVGHQVQLSGGQDFGRYFRVDASLVRFVPGKALDGLQDDAINFVQLVVTLRH